MRTILPLLSLLAAAPFASPEPASAQQGFSEYAQIFVNVCLQHAPGFSEAAISRSVSQEAFNARGTLAGAGVQVQDGRSCNLRIGGGGTAVGAPSDDEVQRLAVWYAQRLGGGEVRRKRSKIGGKVWYEVRSGRSKYSVSTDTDRGVLSFWVAKR